MSNKKLQSEKRKAKQWCSVRISGDTRKLAEGILKTANEKQTGRKIKLDELLQAGLALIQPAHIERLQENSLTNEDRKEILRQKYIAERGEISRDDFTGFMMTAAFHEFLAAQEKKPIAA
jgi:Rps23 Pro-64 3,4-dihydroxylase Tpa1-like proline 4-hydroxylase